MKNIALAQLRRLLAPGTRLSLAVCDTLEEAQAAAVTPATREVLSQSAYQMRVRVLDSGETSYLTYEAGSEVWQGEDGRLVLRCGPADPQGWDTFLTYFSH